MLAPFKYLLFLAIGTLALSRVRLELIEVVLILLFTYMALYSSRHIPLFTIIVTPIVGKYINIILRRNDTWLTGMLNTRAANLALLNAQLKGHVWPVIALFAVVVLAQKESIRFSFDRSGAPVEAVNFLKSERLSGNLFSSDRFGDYLVYAAWPQYRVFIDGRSDMYGSDRAREYLQVVLVQPGWKEVLAKHNINFLLINTNSPLSLLLDETDAWRLIYSDQTANIFVNNSATNTELIHKYRDVKLATNDEATRRGKGL